MRAQVRSPNHSAKNFARAHLLGGQRIVADDDHVDGDRAKHNGSRRRKEMLALRAATAAVKAGDAKNDGRIRHQQERHEEMLAIRAAATAPAKKTNGHDLARSLGAAAATVPKKVTTSENQEDPKMSTATTPTTSASAPPAPAARCQHRDGSGARARCNRDLGPKNKTGYCDEHRDLHRAKSSSSNGNGHAHHAAKSNGKTNGHVAEDSPQKAVIAKRVRLMLEAVDLLPVIDDLLQVIPIEDKQKFVERWLTGAA
jgi:hypothetical protein